MRADGVLTACLEYTAVIVLTMAALAVTLWLPPIEREAEPRVVVIDPIVQANVDQARDVRMITGLRCEYCRPEPVFSDWDRLLFHVRLTHGSVIADRLQWRLSQRRSY